MYLVVGIGGFEINVVVFGFYNYVDYFVLCIIDVVLLDDNDWLMVVGSDGVVMVVW